MINKKLYIGSIINIFLFIILFIIGITSVSSISVPFFEKLFDNRIIFHSIFWIKGFMILLTAFLFQILFKELPKISIFKQMVPKFRHFNLTMIVLNAFMIEWLLVTYCMFVI
ncbi:hypothetical protein DY052_08395 [Apilactobacillus timberlakei]|uniref:hypothetical protein n=1 Tax=Apilactobacillus timberlakei TaxID=2008380 RepID=UPI00112BC74C|nr:hypothetical protein [Apilactobacillus timberlakei]TPR13009.1 hypothetical protein DY052_08395 [Apilactobacillus timberlakei]